ncbi:hypothetical protein [Natronorubrum daqingense]|uniref:Uncharacterized protein n=1 Tax=Natronorubrum daqingense TaxID=588898 RepID=A0A1N7FXT5_9EURY|nr:hypothetical protein [Natronorubrum daqingense]APX98544.1 hypothetical protein BB347_17720 [Natronorubrum daqingense]SIS05132.1 hypothetical protein SAMN05421809_3550 [Natronorubrum daqingense]
MATTTPPDSDNDAETVTEERPEHERDQQGREQDTGADLVTPQRRSQPGTDTTVEASTTNADNSLWDGLRTVTEACLETALWPSTLEIRSPCIPDGDWMAVDDYPHRKTWSRTRPEYDERVQLVIDGLTGGWTLLHQTGAGRQRTIETGLSPTEAYREAEQVMADLESVPLHSRTGRAAV